MIRKFHLLFALIMALSGRAYAAEVNFTSFSAHPFTAVESDGRLSLHIRVCGKGISVDGKNIDGNQCARLKISKRSGRAWAHSIIFESKHFSAFPIRTRDQDGSNFKFWLQEKSSNDTQNFRSFLKKAPRDGQAVLGGLCKQLTDKTFADKVVRGAVRRALALGRLDERVMNGLQSRRDRNAPMRIAKRCKKTAEREIGEVFITIGTLNAVPSVTTSICGFKVEKNKTRSDLVAIQNGLKKRKLYTGGADGIFGKGSCRALKQWTVCENVSSKLLSDSLLAKLNTTNPSQRELNCYANNYASQNEPKDNVLGPRVRLSSITTSKAYSGTSCNQSKLQVRSNQNVLKSLDLYTSTVDGIPGPNYRTAIAGGEKLLGQWANENNDCLGVSELKILNAVVAARKRGSSCEYLPSSTEIKNRFNGLKSAGVVDKEKLDHEKASGLIWMIDTVSDLEMRLSFLNFYSSTKSSLRDCRLDNEELKALKPTPAEPTVPSEIPAESISMAAVKTAGSATISLVVESNDLETSLVSKSVFGLGNQVKMDIKFDTASEAPILDFVVSEDDTKINLHFFDQEVQSRGFAAGLKELTLGKTSNDQSAFFIRMWDSGKSNIDNGDFRKLLAKMPGKDHAIISALCDHVAGVSTSSEGFEAQFSNSEDKASFRSSLFSNPQVRGAVNKLATQCVTEVRSTEGVESSFKINTPLIVCTAAENDGLASLDAQIAAEQKSLLGVKDEINQLQSQRLLFQFKECTTYSNNADSNAKRLVSLQKEITKSKVEAKNRVIDLDAGRIFATRLADLKAPADICIVENKALREDVNEYLLKLDRVFFGIQCPNSADTLPNPVQIVIDEINADILALLEVHISQDEIAGLQTERDKKLQDFTDLAAQLTTFEQSKASPAQVQEQTGINTSLSQTIVDIEARSLSLESELRDLDGVLADNAGMIENIDALNQRLAELSAQKDSRQSVLDEAKSTLLGAQAVISQQDLEISKLEGQISNLDIQMEAASSTAGTLSEEVVQLGQNIAGTTERVTKLEANVSEAQALIDNANGAIGQKSQELSRLALGLRTKVAEATTLSNSVTTLRPQADAAEKTIEGMRASLETDYVPIEKFQEKAARLNELTQAVTERTKLIQELLADLESIEQEEQLFIKMCISDAKCKDAMGERLGADQ